MHVVPRLRIVKVRNKDRRLEEANEHVLGVEGERIVCRDDLAVYHRFQGKDRELPQNQSTADIIGKSRRRRQEARSLIKRGATPPNWRLASARDASTTRVAEWRRCRQRSFLVCWSLLFASRAYNLKLPCRPAPAENRAAPLTASFRTVTPRSNSCESASSKDVAENAP
jgi:hypothetical protein